MSGAGILLRRLAPAVCVAAAWGTGAPAAQAVHWPHFGGDAGRSGNQPVDRAGLPVSGTLWKRTGPGESGVRTSIVTSAGAPAVQRLAFGTHDPADGARVHLQLLSTGAPVGPEAGIDIDEGELDEAGLGVPAGGNAASGYRRATSLTFADTSTAAGLGQLFVVHNDTDRGAGRPDIEIAQVDEASGTLVRQVDVTGSNGFVAESAVVATAPAADGSRDLFFVGRLFDGSQARLFRVPIASAGTATASVGEATSVVVDATPASSPTLVSLAAGGAPATHVAVGTQDGRVVTFRTSDLTAGPASPALDGVAQTPAVPVQPTGTTPGPGQPVAVAPAVYVAVSRDATGGGATVVHRLSGADLSRQAASPPLEGPPAPALALTHEADGAGERGRVVVTTGANVHVLDAADLTAPPASRYPARSGEGTPGTTGFLSTTAAVSGDLAFLTTDNGIPLVLRLADAQPVPPEAFAADPEAVPLTAGAAGQPSLSRGYVQFSTPAGVFVHRAADITDPALAVASPGQDERVGGSIVLAALASDARGIRQVDFAVDGRPVGTVGSPASGSPFGPPGGRYEVRVDAAGLGEGPHTLTVTTSDESGRQAAAGPRAFRVTRQVGPPPGPDSAPTVAIRAPGAGGTLRTGAVISAVTSDDRGVASVTFRLGSRTLCTDFTVPFACTFRPRPEDVGRRTLRAIATDRAGLTATAERAVDVARVDPASVTLRVTPRHDGRAPFRFTAAGTVRLPAGVSRAACRRGRVTVTLGLRGRDAVRRRAALTSRCTYRTTISLGRSSRAPRLSVRAAFSGTTVLAPRSSATRTVRAG